MIVTIDDYRGAADSKAASSNNEQIKHEEDDSTFTVARAGHLKLKLQALNNALVRTPLDQHDQFQFDEILQGALPRTYVNGSEEVYFLVKDLPWPSRIPDVFARAYGEVVQSRPFINAYIHRPSKENRPDHSSPVSARFAPTFSSIRPLLPGIDSACNTTLNNYFERADGKVKPFAFMQLPTELRLQVYDYLVPTEAYVRVYSREALRVDERLPVHLEITRVSKALHEETTRHFFNKPTLLVEAWKKPIGKWNQVCFTKHTANEYAALITGMSVEVRRRFTRLEIRIASDFPEAEQKHVHDQLDDSPLRQICAALPNLEIVVVSFQKIDAWTKAKNGIRLSTTRDEHFYGRKLTLDWIRAQLPEKGLRIAWDLTYFRNQVADAARFRDEIMSERMARELIQRNGSLELVQSATATREDLQRWSEIRGVVLEALEIC